MRRQILLFLLAIFCFNISHGVDSKGMIMSKDSVESPKSEGKKILIFCTSESPYTSWFLYDPLILSMTNIEVTKVFLENNDFFYPDLSSQQIALYDLIIVPFPHHIKQEYIDGLLNYIDRGGSLFLVQPTFDSPDQACLLLGKIGITFLGLEDKTPTVSLITDHYATRILGLPEGKSVYPHRSFKAYMKFKVDNGAILSRLGLVGDPDLFVDSTGRVSIVATDIFNDLEAHGRGDMEYPEYKKNIGYLFINTIRNLLGFDFFRQPVQKPQQRWSDFFYAYAAGREYLLAAREEEPFSSRLSKDELNSEIKKGDQGIWQAAKFEIKGQFEECKMLFAESVKILSDNMNKMTKVDRYIIRGWHSSILTPEYYGGGLRGYGEPEWQDLLIKWMTKQEEWIKRSGSRRIVDMYANDWELFSKYYPDDVQLIRQNINEGYLEAVHGLFSAAYLPILSEESNIRQFHYGLKGFKEIFGININSYHNPRDHFDFHPQLPQILNNYGYKCATLRASPYMSEIKPFRLDKIWWQGLDGSEIEAVPTYQDKSIHDGRGLFRAKNIAKADQLGYHSILLGGSFDASTDLIGEKEHTLLNPISPIIGKWVTIKEFFENTPKAGQSFFLGVDDLYAKHLEYWSSWGCMNEAYEWNRTTENKILAAEKLSVIANTLNKNLKDNQTHLQHKLDEAWKSLLMTQDHMAFGPVDYSNQVPPAKLNPGEEKNSKHIWGYDFALFSSNLQSEGGMENYAEQGTDNYAGPMIPGSRYETVKRIIKKSQNIADTVLIKSLSIILKENKSKFEKDCFLPFTVFNQLGWQKRDIVTLEKEFKEGEIFHFVLSDGKKEIPSQVISVERFKDGSIKKITTLFFADVPALGYKTYFLKSINKEHETGKGSFFITSTTHVENDYYIIEIDADHGGLTRIFDKELGVDLLSPHQVGNELFSPFNPAVSSVESRAKVELLEKGPLRLTTMIKSKIGGVPYECKINLYKDIKRIDFDLTIDFGKIGHNFGTFAKDETGLFIRFPLSFVGKLYVNQPFGIYETTKERQVALDFADLYQGQYGLTLIHRNSPAFQYKQGVLSMILAQGKPYVVGKQNYQYSICSHKEDPFYGDTYNIAKSINTPLILHWSERQNKGLPGAFSFLTIDKPNIILSALYSDGDTICARFYERSGKNTEVNIDLPYLKTMECNQVKLNMESIQKIENLDGKLKLNFKPWEIITLTFKNNL